MVLARRFVRRCFFSPKIKVREVVVLMEAAMYKTVHPENEIRPPLAGIQCNNPLKIARMATVLDARTKNAAWASPAVIEE